MDTPATPVLSACPTGWYTGHMEGPATALRARLASMAGREDVLLASRATVGLVAVLRALRLPPGSEVLMPAMLCANPALAVRLAGLRPLFADISPLDLNLDLESAARVVGRQTRVLLAVPLFGHSLDAEAVERFAADHDLLLVEDAAHAVGIRYGQRPAGSLGICSLFSFGRGKMADAGGGAAVLGDPRLLARVGAELARSARHAAGGVGVPGGLDVTRLDAALDHLPQELAERARAVRELRSALAGQGSTGVPAAEAAATESRPLWRYSVLMPGRAERDRLTRDLLREGVEAANLYPPLPLFFPEARDSRLDRFPVAWDTFNRIVTVSTLLGPVAGRSD